MHLLPHPPLPIWHTSERPEIPLRDSVSPALGRRQEQNLVLQIRRQADQVHDLRQARARYVAQAGKFRLEGKTYQVQDGDIFHVRFSV